MALWNRLAIVVCLLCAPAALSPQAFSQPARPPAATPAERPAEPVRRLPADTTTKHTIELPGRTLQFTATAGSLTLSDAAGVAQAQIGYVAFTRDTADITRRPVSFAMNGGPGSASAWLDLGLLGPWRLRMDPDSATPSASPVTVDNADTWLDFTDLVFIDPIGTGFSKLLVNTEENRKKYWSVNGDVASIADAIRIWLETARRLTSPKYVIGESYSGLRGPKLVRELTTAQSVGVTGLVLISPKLDYGGRSLALQAMEWAAQLPSLVAASRAKQGPVTRAQMTDVETYAGSEYLVDLIRGEDPDAMRRRIDHIVAYTGLDRALVEKRHGKINNAEFLHEEYRDTHEIGSFYDATVLKADPFPELVLSGTSDSMTDALQPALVSAMLDIYARRLNWLPEARYEISNGAVNRAWDFGNGYYRPESTSALRQALAQDPHLHVLIGHGLFDLVTPYFDTKMMLDQIPRSVGAERVRFEVYPGGHMFYSRDESRSQFREAAQKLYEQN